MTESEYYYYFGDGADDLPPDEIPSNLDVDDDVDLDEFNVDGELAN